jgi:hypothetical protein
MANSKKRQLQDESFNPEQNDEKLSNDTNQYDDNYLADFKLISKDKIIFNVSKLILATSSPWFNAYFVEYKNQTELELDCESIDIHCWLASFHPVKNNPVNTMDFINNMSQERIGKFMELCLKYQMNNLLEMSKHRVKTMKITNIDLIKIIINVKPLNDLFLVVLDNFTEIPDDIIDKISIRFMHKYMTKKIMENLQSLEKRVIIGVAYSDCTPNEFRKKIGDVFAGERKKYQDTIK